MFEYRWIETVDRKKMQSVLDEYASAGWRLMSANERIYHGDSYMQYTLLFERVKA